MDRVTIQLDASQLAEDINRDATPDFKLTLIRKLLSLDPQLQHEILGNVRPR
jgi:hypothetical protein